MHLSYKQLLLGELIVPEVLQDGCDIILKDG